MKSVRYFQTVQFSSTERLKTKTAAIECFKYCSMMCWHRTGSSGTGYTIFSPDVWIYHSARAVNFHSTGTGYGKVVRFVDVLHSIPRGACCARRCEVFLPGDFRSFSSDSAGGYGHLVVL